MDAYQNPGTIPPVGSFTWVPALFPDGGSTGYGFNYTQIERGQFRNDLPGVPTPSYASDSSYSPDPGYTPDVGYCQVYSTAPSGLIASGAGSLNWPFFTAFRYLPQPQEDIGAAPTLPFILKPDTNNEWQWQIKLLDSPNFATFELTYSLLVDITQPSILPLLTSADSALLAKYQHSGNQGDPPGIDWTQYAWGQVTFVDTSGRETEYPAVDSKGNPVQLVCTDFFDRPSYKTLTTQIKIGAGKLPENFPHIQYIRVKNRHNLNALILQVNKVMLFNAQRVNIPNSMLPCSMLAYAADVSFPFTADQGVQLAYPTYSTTPNFHLKVFSPDYNGLSVGFAHSIRLEFLMVSIPIPGSGIQDMTSLVGVLSDSPANDLWMVTFVGPFVGQRSVQLTLIDQQVVNAPGRVIEMDSITIPANCTQLYLQKAQSYSGTTAPGGNVQWLSLNNSNITPGTAQTINTISGPFVGNYLYLDANASSNAWYRIVQTLPNGQFTSPPIQNSPYSERSVLSMMDSTDGPVSITQSSTITRRVPLITSLPGSNPMLSKPFAIFCGQDTNPYNPITLTQGTWGVHFRGCVNDTSLLTETHIFARFWFQPAASAYDINSDPPLYQASTEVHFETNDSGSTLVLGPPSSLDQMIVSPPLPNQLSVIDIVRYVDSAVGFPSSWTPFHSGAQLVVALYAVSYLTPAGKSLPLTSTTLPSPTFSFELNSNYAYVSTTIQQQLSQTLYPQQANRYGSSTYLSYPSPLYVGVECVGGGLLTNTEQTTYTKYTGQYQSSAQSIPDAFTGLVAIQTSTDPIAAQIYLPYKQIAAANDQSVSLYGDFATNSLSLGFGRVENGNWDIVVLLNTDKDTPYIDANYRLEAFLATEDGVVTEYIFRSPLLQPSSVSSKPQQKIEYKPTISIPYEISGANTQLVLRITVYPYYNNQQISIAALQSLLGSSVPLGCRVDSIEIVSNTLSTLDLHETASLLGSPAFYEGLPIIPTQALDSQQFWFVVSPDLQQGTIVPGDGSFSITGQLYSPTWEINLPVDMEVDFGADTISAENINNCVKFRSVVSTGTTQKETNVSAVQDKLSGTIHLVGGANSTSVSSQSVSTMSSNQTINHYIFNQPYDPPVNTFTVSGINGGTTTPLNAYNPDVAIINHTSLSAFGSQLVIVGTVDEAQSPTFVAVANSMGGDYAQWKNPVDDSSFSSLCRITSGLQFPSIVASRQNRLLTVAGWAQPGSIVVKEVNISDISNDGPLPYGMTFLIDGSPNPVLFGGQTFVAPVGGSGTGAVAVYTTPSIAINDREQLMVVYALQGYDGDLYMRMALSGQAFSAPQSIVSLAGGGISRSANIACFGPNLISHENQNTQYIIWWCGGKIFFSTVDIDGGGNSRFGKPQLVAGSRNFTDTSNPANASFAQLQALGSIIVDQSGANEKDLPKQRAGAIVVDSWPSQGNVWVYYTDTSGQLWTRQVRVMGNVGEAIPINSTPTA